MPDNRRGLWQQVEPRRVNAEPWEPLDGMVKRRCLACWFWFAAPVGTPRVAYCRDCLGVGIGKGKRVAYDG
jgi:hypothetical protein